jgi:hypothetical protein
VSASECWWLGREGAKGRYPLRLAFHQPFKYLHQIDLKNPPQKKKVFTPNSWSYIFLKPFLDNFGAGLIHQNLLTNLFLEQAMNKPFFLNKKSRKVDKNFNLKI